MNPYVQLLDRLGTNELNFYLVRNPRSEANKNNVFSGRRVDSPVSEEGWREWDRLQRNIKHTGHLPRMIIHTDMKRTREPAQKLAGTLGILKDRLIAERGLQERDWGSLAGRQKPAYLHDLEDALPPDVEPKSAYYERSNSALIDALEEYHKEGSPLFVVHRGTLGALTHAFGLKVDHFLPNAMLYECKVRRD